MPTVAFGRAVFADAISRSSTTQSSFVVLKVRDVSGVEETKPVNRVNPTVGSVADGKTKPLDSVMVPEPTPLNPKPP